MNNGREKITGILAYWLLLYWGGASRRLLTSYFLFLTFSEKRKRSGRIRNRSPLTARFSLIFLFALPLPAQPLQPILDKTPAGAKITLPAGRFEGPVVIDKPLILQGSGDKTVIEGDRNGHVIIVRAAYVTLENLTIEGGGRQRYRLDAAIFAKNQSHITVRNCRIDETLFGIVMHNVRHIRIQDNTIISYSDKVADNRGDAVRIWNGKDIEVSSNRIRHTRDLSINRVWHTLIADNVIEDARYGVLSNMCRDIAIRRNRIHRAYAGIYQKGGRQIHIADNTVVKTRLATGTGILLAHGSDIHVVHNILTGCAQALYIDSSPAEMGMQRYIERNKIAYNDTAFHFHAALKNNMIMYNNVIGNLEDVVRDIAPSRPYDPKANRIAYNYWDRYEGFDRNHDGIGDTPYLVLVYADRLWQHDHHLKFFYATPVMTLLDFLARIAPFTEPELLLEDTLPLIMPAEASPLPS